MVPTIGLIIGAYIVLRCFEIMGRADASWRDRGVRRFIQVMAFVVAGWTFLLSADLVWRGLTPSERESARIIMRDGRAESYENSWISRLIDALPSDPKRKNKSSK